MADVIVKSDATALDLLLEKVYREGGYDFREYKPGMVTRRLERRLRAAGLNTYPDYMKFLDDHPEEYQRLAEDLTIKVGGFFRSPYAFQQLARVVLPELVACKREQGERRLRIWSTACARGEEPYSIAILLAESLGRELRSFDISIYATDISRQALKEAQVGVYSAKDVESLPSTILEGYFTHSKQGYEVTADIRRMLRFFYFDLTSTVGQVFTGLDCIFCCNVLIYLQKALQERVLNMLYSSLATPGYLILGEVETPTGSLREKLECLDSKAKIYKKNRNR
ncbi:Chemotaxis protein methyltransferase [subsurface metagenome]